jgi:RimJ/RimL family protein N-acetyltransferase
MVVAQTDRLVLKEFSNEDVDGFFELNNDPEVIQYTGDVAFEDKTQVLQFIQDYDQYRLNGFGRWSLYLKAGNEYIGFCGIRRSQNSEEVDLGFRLLKSYWNQGYAYEAAIASLVLGFETHGITRVIARAMNDNAASHALIRKLGFSLLSTFEEDGRKWTKYELNSNDFKAPQ